MKCSPAAGLKCKQKKWKGREKREMGEIRWRKSDEERNI